MSDLYLKRPVDFHPYGLPQLPGKSAFHLIYGERFDVLPDEESLTYGRATYPSATAWPAGWQTWNPGDLPSLQTEYCDAVLRCGVVTVAGSTADADIVNGKLRAFPDDDPDINNWRVFARVGMGPAAMLPGDAAKAYGGLLISGADLLGADAATGAFNLAAAEAGAAGSAQTWADFETRTNAQTVVPVCSQLIVQLVMGYDGAEELTRVVAMFSEDGKGFSLINPQNPGLTNAVWEFDGRPRCIGLAANAKNNSSDPGPAFPAPWSARLDYLSIYGSADNGVTMGEGGLR